MSDKARALIAQLELPAIVAPMFLVSCPALTAATCAEGIVGSFPAHSTRSRDIFEDWLRETEDRLAALREAEHGLNIAPYGVNLVTHATNERLAGDLELCIKHKVPVVLTSKSTPAHAVKEIQAYGGIVFHDVASWRHAEKAIEAGVDGIILVAHGAGGHTGTINPFALMNEVRSFYDGPSALARSNHGGRDILAAQAMGADCAYIGTRFIATQESIAPAGHKEMILRARSTDIIATAALDGAPASFITKSLVDAGIDLDVLRTTLPGKVVSTTATRKRWRDIWSAGQGVGASREIVSARLLVRQMKAEYVKAKRDFAARTRLSHDEGHEALSAT
jgi:nitronate monooxygenase